jgi:ribonuclease G
MKKSENRTALEKKMSELLKNDPTVTACSELSRFGLMEMTRKRVRPGINEIMTEICPTCNGIGRVFSTKTTVSKIDRWLHRAQADNITSPVKIIVSESMFEYIERNNLSQQFENDYNIDLCFEVSKRLDKDEFEIYIADQSEHITEKHL